MSAEALKIIEFDLSLIAGETTTGEQLQALVEIATRWKATVVKAGTGGFGLSRSYIGFSLYDDEHRQKHLISGGIDQEGRIST